MEILKRYKDVSGNTVAYDVKCEGIVKKLSKQDTIFFADNITNANYIANSGEFRAKAGFHIETIIDNSSLMARQSSVVTNKAGTSFNNAKYYGEGFIKVCKKIRLCAIGGNIRIDTSRHKSNEGRNLQLFNLIRACSISVESFIQGYLSVLQPYSLENFEGSRVKSKDNVWICNVGYSTKLLIKLRYIDNHDVLVVSFHESNIRGKGSLGQRDFSDKPCAVLVDKEPSSSRIGNENNIASYRVNYCIQRGFLRLNLEDFTNYYNNGVALLSYDKIKCKFEDVMQEIYVKLIQLYSNTDNITNSSVININKLSFMAFGNMTVNNICYLLDLYTNVFTGKRDRLFIAGVVMNLIDEMPADRKIELKVGLNDRYSGSPNKLYKIIMEGLLNAY